jgi:hypothetical protein
VSLAALLADDGRTRLGKLVALLGSDNAGERDNALAALGRTLTDQGLDWAWLANLAAHGEVPDSKHSKLFARVVGERLQRSLARAWAMADGDARFVRQVLGCLVVGQASSDEIERALKIADDVKRKAR